jgi:hypothetical protein
MKQLATLIASFLVAGTAVFAHGSNDHIRGVITQISERSVTIQTAGKTTKTQTLTLTAKTTFDQGGKPAHLSDLKVGDRVVIDVPEKTTEALLIRFGTVSKIAKPKSSK